MCKTTRRSFGKTLVKRVQDVKALRQGFDFGMLFCSTALETVYRRYNYKILADRPVTLVNDNGKEEPAPEKNFTMWCPLAKKEFSQGDIHLQGNDW